MRKFSLASTDFADVLIIGGGPAGLAMAHRLERDGLEAVIVEASDQPGGSWPLYYDSLKLFSPRRWSALPGLAFPGDPKTYPSRDEVVAYLARYAGRLATPILTGRRVASLRRRASAFEAEMENGDRFRANHVVVATGGFTTPNWPEIANASAFEGRILHSADYRAPHAHAGERIGVVGGGNTAVQIAVELADHAEVVLLSRKPLRFLPQTLLGLDLHDWLRLTGLDRGRFLSDSGVPVIDDGRYRRALAASRPPRLPMFDSYNADGIVWTSGARRRLDTVIYATGYRPGVGFLTNTTGALLANGLPDQRQGRANRVPNLYFAGLPLQRNFASATLRGFGPDADWIARSILKGRRA